MEVATKADFYDPDALKWDHYAGVIDGMMPYLKAASIAHYQEAANKPGSGFFKTTISKLKKAFLEVFGEIPRPQLYVEGYDAKLRSALMNVRSIQAFILHIMNNGQFQEILDDCLTSPLSMPYSESATKENMTFAFADRFLSSAERENGGKRPQGTYALTAQEYGDACRIATKDPATFYTMSLMDRILSVYFQDMEAKIQAVIEETEGLYDNFAADTVALCSGLTSTTASRVFVEELMPFILLAKKEVAEDAPLIKAASETVQPLASETAAEPHPVEKKESTHA